MLEIRIALLKGKHDIRGSERQDNVNQTSYPRTLSGVDGIGSQVTSMSAADRLFADTLSGATLGTAKEQRNVEALIQKALHSQRGKIGLSQRMKPWSHLRGALLHFNGNSD